MKKILAVFLTLCMSACSSEIDKCVQTGMKAYELMNPGYTVDKRAQAEARWRIACLEAASGKSKSD